MDIKCKDCGKSFYLTDSEKEFYKLQGWDLPKRCNNCKSKLIKPGSTIYIGAFKVHECFSDSYNLTKFSCKLINDFNIHVKFVFEKCNKCGKIFSRRKNFLIGFTKYNFIFYTPEDQLLTISKSIDVETPIYIGYKHEHPLTPFYGTLVDDNDNSHIISFKKCLTCDKLFTNGKNKDLRKGYTKYNFIDKIQNVNETVSEHKNKNIFRIEKKTDCLDTKKDFLVRINAFKCINSGHLLMDINATIKIVTYYGEIEIISISAGYCKSCKKYYILESEYQSLKKRGTLICRIVENNIFISKEHEGHLVLNQESLLHILGYNVNAKDDFSETHRHLVLKTILEDNLLSKFEIINHIDYLINRGRNNPLLANAISKWEADRSFVRLYDVKNDGVTVNSITQNIYHKK